MHPTSSPSSSGRWRDCFQAALTLGWAADPGLTSSHCALCAARLKPPKIFPQDVLEAQAFLAPAVPNQRILAVPAARTEEPLPILGSSDFRAMLAAEHVPPYAI